jgi:hypothetical protein
MICLPCSVKGICFPGRQLWRRDSLHQGRRRLHEPFPPCSISAC